MIRNIVLGAASVAALTFASAASAADLPAYEPAPAVAAPVPSFSWTGPYIGIQGGYSWGDTNIGGIKPKGFVVGGYAGYNYQFDNSPVVVGIETDFNYADIDDKSGGVKAQTRWNGATRARLGYAFENFLVYGAGGIAYADRKVRVAGFGKDSKTAVGWTVGGGLEYAATDNVSVRADYRYADYGKDSFSFSGARGRADYSEHRVMAGVAYKFGW
ncbi:outer membrane protein [Hansschlegelia beijingensis]|uniref:Outer membrane immunogenic protein n=1 Tax=Hansschlegelia beijingensis TaxID=1133344 RepID=A0A7W6CWE2_9HYPH|nr:outer membrane protein [Hansschlegelia beijingensis]MBB3972353.1 outer membrane immunogenic protein [Hansschlegelia beijingensis]